MQGEKLFDLVVRLEPQFRENPEEIGNILVATPDGQQIPLKELADIRVANGASFIYREDNSRYIGVQYSVEGRDLAGAVEDAERQVAAQVAAARGLPGRLGRRIQGVHGVAAAADHRAAADAVRDLPAAVRALQQLQVPAHHRARRAAVRARRRPGRAVADGHAVLGLVGIGFLALFGVSVQTAVVYISYANELRLAGMGIAGAPRARRRCCGCGRS